MSNEKKIQFNERNVENLGSFTTDTSGQLDVFGHNGDTLSMDGAQIGVFKQTNQVCFTSLLQFKLWYATIDEQLFKMQKAYKKKKKRVDTKFKMYN